MDFKLFKPGFILFAISLIAGFLLAAVFQITAEPRAIAAKEAEQEAMATILPAATDFVEVTENYELTDGVYIVVEGLANNNLEGYIVGVATSGYGGELNTLVAFDSEGVIQNINVVKHSETPGLGALATEEDFSNQYINKTAPLTVVKGVATKDDEISAITGSTITTNGVTDGVNAASDYFNKFVKGGN